MVVFGTLGSWLFYPHGSFSSPLGSRGEGRWKPVSLPTGASGARVDLCNGVFVWGNINLFLGTTAAFLCRAP